MPRKMTPLKAIREKCLECSGGDKQEVQQCALTHCPLFPYRLGLDPHAPLQLPQEPDMPPQNVTESKQGGSEQKKPGKPQSKGGEQLTLF